MLNFEKNFFKIISPKLYARSVGKFLLQQGLSESELYGDLG